MLTARSFVTEQTGGGNTALVKVTSAGPVVVVSDGNFGTDVYADGAAPVALLFATQDDWYQGEDPILEHDGPAVDVLAIASYWAGQ